MVLVQLSLGRENRGKDSEVKPVMLVDACNPTCLRQEHHAFEEILFQREWKTREGVTTSEL